MRLVVQVWGFVEGLGLIVLFYDIWNCRAWARRSVEGEY